MWISNARRLSLLVKDMRRQAQYAVVFRAAEPAGVTRAAVHGDGCHCRHADPPPFVNLGTPRARPRRAGTSSASTPC